MSETCKHCKQPVILVKPEWVHKDRLRGCPPYGFTSAEPLEPSPSLEATLAKALRNLADSIRRRKGSKLIHINHDELRELIPKARAALAAYDAQEKGPK